MEQINRYVVNTYNEFNNNEDPVYVESSSNYISALAEAVARDKWDEYGGWDDIAQELGWNLDEVVEDSPEEEQMIEEVEFEIQKNPPFSYDYRIFEGTDEEWDELNVMKW